MLLQGNVLPLQLQAVWRFLIQCRTGDRCELWRCTVGCAPSCSQACRRGWHTWRVSTGSTVVGSFHSGRPSVHHLPVVHGSASSVVVLASVHINTATQGG